MHAAPSVTRGSHVTPGSHVTHGIARAVFAHRQGATRLSDLRQEQPLRVLFPTPGTRDAMLAAVTNVAGGLVAGDVHDVAIEAGPGARVLVAAQAAEKVYRSRPRPDGATVAHSDGMPETVAGPDCVIDVSLRCGEGGWLEWLPQETILFQGARLRRATRIQAAGDARVLAGEMLALGRWAHGERFTSGLLRESWRVHHDERLVWADDLRLEGAFEHVLDSPAGFGGAVGLATLLYLGPDAAEHLEPLRDVLTGNDPRLRSGATLVNGVLVARWLAQPHPEALSGLRDGYAGAWTLLRSRAGGLPPRLPRFWHI